MIDASGDTRKRGFVTTDGRTTFVSLSGGPTPAGERTPPGDSASRDASFAGGLPPAGDGASRNASFALVTQLTTAAFTAGLTFLLVRVLGPREYGVFALAVGIGALISVPADFGVSESAARFIAEHRGDGATMARLLGSALRLKLAIGTLVSVALIAGSGPIADAYGAPEMTWPLRAVALAVAGQGFMFLFARALEAMGRVSLNLRIVFAESAAETSASVVFVLLAGGATAAAAGRAAGYLFGAVMAVALALRRLHLPRGQVVAGSRIEARTIARYAAALLVVDAAFTAFSQIDTVLIGAYLGTVSVAFWSAPLRLVAFLRYPGAALAAGVAPRLAGQHDRGQSVRRFQSALRGLLVLECFLVVPLLVWSEPIVRLALGPRYLPAAAVLRALVPFIFLGGLAELTSVAVNYLGEARRRMPIAVGTVLINVVVDIALIPRIGVIGAAIGTDLAYLLYVPAHFLLCRRALGLRLRPLALTLARSLLAAGAMAGVLVLIGQTGLGPAQLAAGAVLGTVMFLTVLCLVGELSVATLLATAHRVAALVPKRPRLGRATAAGRRRVRARLARARASF
jgi:O-antigen/teichoic acid export membrane protein